MNGSIRPLLGKGHVRASEEHAEAFHTASWLDDRVTFDHRWLACREGELAWTAPRHLIVLTEEGGTSQTQVRVGGSRAYEGRDRPGALSFVPSSADRFCTYRNCELVYTALWIDPSVQDRLHGCDGLTVPAPVVNGNDGVIGSLMGSLRDEMSAGEPPGAAYIEHLVAMILLRLAKLDGTAPQAEIRGSRLNRRVLARIQDYIETNIGADIALSELAELADLPVDGFARRFRATTGLAPYAYVIERRIRHAETLLRTTDKEIAVIALSLGFSSQSHLTTTFRRRLGTTPRAYRAQFSPKI